jgi:hypothetical protein
MDKVKTLIDYYKNVKNLLYDILLSIGLFIFSVGLHYTLRSILNKKPDKITMIMLPYVILLILLIYRPYRLKLISQYGYYFNLLIIIILYYII